MRFSRRGHLFCLEKEKDGNTYGEDFFRCDYHDINFGKRIDKCRITMYNSIENQMLIIINNVYMEE